MNPHPKPLAAFRMEFRAPHRERLERLLKSHHQAQAPCRARFVRAPGKTINAEIIRINQTSL
jgi:hypothetical protein